jgi:hypothetical protein
MYGIFPSFNTNLLPNTSPHLTSLPSKYITVLHGRVIKMLYREEN